MPEPAEPRALIDSIDTTIHVVACAIKTYLAAYIEACGIVPRSDLRGEPVMKVSMFLSF
jgi:hypothetical protein